jgi:hypothetical protein
MNLHDVLSNCKKAKDPIYNYNAGRSAPDNLRWAGVLSWVSVSGVVLS